MKLFRLNTFVLICSIFGAAACQKDAGTPIIDSIEPAFGPTETLLVIEGTNLGGIQRIQFGDQDINWNTAYNSDVALLLRVPTSISLGDQDLILTTAGGSAVTKFRVTLDAPEIFSVTPESGAPGDLITFVGKNFYEPLEVYFYDSLLADIIFSSEDSMIVRVPEGIEKGRIRLIANGGDTLSPVDFFTVDQVLVNDFDGNGVRSDTERWIFRGSVDQSPFDAVQNSNPEAYDGHFMKLSGRDQLDIGWIGGAQNHFGFPGDNFTGFGLTANRQNTFLEMEINNNGQNGTQIILILNENGGSFNDFTYELKVDGVGWQTISVPLTRFTDLDGIPVDPTKVHVVKVHLNDKDKTGEKMEVNIDNLRFAQIR